MAEIREPAGAGFKIITVLGILFFLLVVALLIQSYDSGRDVAAGPPVTTPATTPPSNAPVVAVNPAPVGAVATGGGGTAGDGTSAVVPVVVALTAVTMLTAGGIALRRREA